MYMNKFLNISTCIFEDCQSNNLTVALLNVEAVLEKVWESLHTGSWADASDGMRKLYSHASLLKVNCINIVIKGHYFCIFIID